MKKPFAHRPLLASTGVLLSLACACGSSAGTKDLPNSIPAVPAAGASEASSLPATAGSSVPSAGSTASTLPVVAMNAPVPVLAAGTNAAGAAAGVGAAGQEAAGAPAPSGIPDLVFNMTGRIEAGAEAMFCQYVQMPKGAKTAVPSAESHYTPGSHHFLVFRTTLTSIPAGEDVAHVCGSPGNTVAKLGSSNGISSAESATGNNGSYYEAQVPNSRRDLPPGVAHVFTPGEILIMTAHYLNTTDAVIDSKIEFRLHLMDPKEVKSEAGTFFLLDTQLNIPAHSEVTFTKSCPITKDINLGLLWSHMHARGYSFKAWTDDAAATQQLGGDVYDQPGPDGWEEPHVQAYPADPPVTLHAGSKLTISCTYRNTTTRTFTFGSSAETAEMCLLHGMYWPRLDSATERCSNGVSMSGKPVAADAM
jgi:hypothetical protein